MLFSLNRKKEMYQSYINAYHKLEKEIEIHKPFGGMCLCTALSWLPDNMLVNIHFHKICNTKFRKVPVWYVKEHLDTVYRLTRCPCIQLDYNYNGTKNPAPVCIFEIPQ